MEDRYISVMVKKLLADLDSYLHNIDNFERFAAGMLSVSDKSSYFNVRNKKHMRSAGSLVLECLTKSQESHLSFCQTLKSARSYFISNKKTNSFLREVEKKSATLDVVDLMGVFFYAMYKPTGYPGNPYGVAKPGRFAFLRQPVLTEIKGWQDHVVMDRYFWLGKRDHQYTQDDLNSLKLVEQAIKNRVKRVREKTGYLKKLLGRLKDLRSGVSLPDELTPEYIRDLHLQRFV